MFLDASSAGTGSHFTSVWSPSLSIASSACAWSLITEPVWVWRQNERLKQKNKLLKLTPRPTDHSLHSYITLGSRTRAQSLLSLHSNSWTFSTPRSRLYVSLRATVQSRQRLVLRQQHSISSTCVPPMTFSGLSTRLTQRHVNLIHCRPTCWNSSFRSCCPSSLTCVTPPFNKVAFHSHRGTPSWRRG